MTNRIAFTLAGLLAILILADIVVEGGATLLILARRFAELVQSLAFWR